MNKGYLHIKTLLVSLILFLLLYDNAFTQWVNDPSSNTKLVIDPVDPINISALKDFNGGAYVFGKIKR